MPMNTKNQPRRHVATVLVLRSARNRFVGIFVCTRSFVTIRHTIETNRAMFRNFRHPFSCAMEKTACPVAVFSHFAQEIYYHVTLSRLLHARRPGTYINHTPKTHIMRVKWCLCMCAFVSVAFLMEKFGFRVASRP